MIEGCYVHFLFYREQLLDLCSDGSQERAFQTAPAPAADGGGSAAAHGAG